LVAVLVTRGGAPLRPQVESVVVVDPSQGRAVKQLALGSIPGAIAIEGRHLWVVNPVDRTISEFDASHVEASSNHWALDRAVSTGGGAR